MTVFLPNLRLQRGVMFVFPCFLARITDEVKHPWRRSSRGEFLGVLSSNFEIFLSTRRSPTRKWRGTVSVFESLL